MSSRRKRKVVNRANVEEASVVDGSGLSVMDRIEMESGGSEMAVSNVGVCMELDTLGQCEANGFLVSDKQEMQSVKKVKSEGLPSLESDLVQECDVRNYDRARRL